MLRRLALALCAFLLIMPNNVHGQAVQSPGLVISEIQVGGLNTDGSENALYEFVELYNQEDYPVDVTGWQLEYFSADSTDTLASGAKPTRVLIVLDGELGSHGYALFSYAGYLDEADGYFGEGSTLKSGLLAGLGGHVRLVDTGDMVIDSVGWGAAKSPETKAVAKPPLGYSAERRPHAEDEVLLTDTDNNFTDFTHNELPTPTGGSLLELALPEPEEAPDCADAIITELLPNPDGADGGNEFIELYNPTDAVIFLESCMLETTANAKKYQFPIASSLPPKTYLAFYDNETELTLANAAGGTVLLVGTSTEYSVDYPKDMKSGYSWSLIDGVWLATDRPTPNTSNLPPLPAQTNQTGEEAETQPESCGPGKFRNPETNRCKNVQVLAASLSPCAAGQVRSPETNRCRNIASLVTTLVPCRPGQERNPETSRCRNVLGTATQATACKEGQERNPETNRCRKVAAVTAASPSVGSSDSQNAPQRLNYIFLGTASAAVLGYGVFEYRRDIGNLLARLKVRSIARRAVK